MAVGDPVASYEFIDRACLRDVDGRPFVPATSLAGSLAALARASLRARGIDPSTSSAYRGLFGEAAGVGGAGQEARVTVRDALVAGQQEPAVVRDRVAVDRRRRAAADHLLFKEEAVHADAFRLDVEFRETGPRTETESEMADRGEDPDAEAWRLLLDAVDLLAHGWGSVGGQYGSGAGRVKLDGDAVASWDRSDPDQFLAFATGRWTAFLPAAVSLREALAAAPLPKWWPVRVSPRVPERLLLSCRLRPVEPLLVRAGFTSEVCALKGASHPLREPLTVGGPPPERDHQDSVDRGFPVDADGHPYVPGSSIRGSLRSRAEQAVRTVACAGRKAWDLDELQRQARRLRQLGDWDESQVPCIVTQTFGFEQLGGRVAFSDAVPLGPAEFERRRKLIDHVANDRFTGGAADKRKFNERPYVPRPGGDSLEPDEHGDLLFEVELFDFEWRHLGLVLLLLRDLALGRVLLGGSQNNGMGKVVLTEVTASVLTAEGGVLWPQEQFTACDTTAGFSIFTTAVTWASPAWTPQAVLPGWNHAFGRAIDECRRYLQSPVEKEQAS